MCHFITATLPADANIEVVGQLARRAGRIWQPVKTSPALDRLQPGETYYYTTPNFCDCGTVLGRMGGAEIAEQQRKIRRLEKRGWSTAKIDRWVADRNKSIGRSDIHAWFDFLTAALSSGATASVGLLLHFYAQSVHDEQFEFHRQNVSMAEIDADFLLGLEEDRLYVFR